MEMVTMHLCTTCEEYYEAYQMANIEAHLCNDCELRAEYAATVADYEARLAELERERDAAVDSLNGWLEVWLEQANMDTESINRLAIERDELAEWKRTAMRDLQMCIDANKNQQGVIMAQRERIDKLAEERDTASHNARHYSNMTCELERERDTLRQQLTDCAKVAGALSRDAADIVRWRNESEDADNGE